MSVDPWAGLTKEESERRKAALSESLRVYWAGKSQQMRTTRMMPAVKAAAAKRRAEGSHAKCTHPSTGRARMRCLRARHRGEQS